MSNPKTAFEYLFYHHCEVIKERELLKIKVFEQDLEIQAKDLEIQKMRREIETFSEIYNEEMRVG